ncbi:MAG: tetraacyldisaccharide 4'-kinase [SAR324 cluster bacterium]
MAALYGALVRLRLMAYRRGWRSTHRLGAVAVAIGNLTAGGTGKTPVVSWLLHEAQAAGLRPACLTRGHGRRTAARLSRVRVQDGTPVEARALGDEAAMLAKQHPAVPFFICPDRSLAARLAAVTDAPDLFVLDDGYQHLRVARDLNVLLVDGQTGFGNGRLLPLGPLREPLSGAGRADVVLVTKSAAGHADAVLSTLRRLGVKAPVFHCDYRPTGLARLDGEATLPPAALAGRRMGQLCGIARPESFRATLGSLGATAAHLEVRPDHHPYPEPDLRRIEALVANPPGAAGSAGSGPEWITTEKDAVKLRGRLKPPAAARLWVLAMEAVPEPAARAFFLDRLRALTLK